MYRDRIDAQRLIFGLLAFFRLNNPPLLIDLDIRLLQLRQNIPTLILRGQVQHLPKHRAIPIKVRRRRKRNKELTPVNRRPRRALRAGCSGVLDRPRRHREHAAGVVSEGREVDFLVQGRGVVDRRAALGDVERKHGFRAVGGGRRGWAEGDVAALDHEAGYQPVEGRVIVCAACAEGEEVLSLY